MSVCDDGTPAHWPQGQAVTWHLSTTHVSADLTEIEVRSALSGAFTEWETPACSGITGQQGSPVAADPFDETVDEVVVGFYEDGWPPEYGVGLLALTRIVWDTDDCELFSGDIAFNGTDWSWVVGAPPDVDDADFQSVATHEIGHLLGVDHTDVGGSTMSFPYGGDVAWRSLGCDDSSAVCALYPVDDTSCVDSTYCPCGHPCVDGFCEGLEVDLVPEECWEQFAPEETFLEEEPNDVSTDATHLEATGGDIVIEGSLHTCGGEDGSPSGDLDWFDFDAPCDGRAFFTVEGSSLDTDLDMVVFVEGESAGDEQGRAVGVPIGVEATVGGDYQVFVYCWSGSPTNYALRVHYLAPGERGALPVDDDDGCGCSSIAARPGSTMLVLTFGVAALTRRRRSSGRPDQLPRDRCH